MKTLQLRIKSQKKSSLSCRAESPINAGPRQKMRVGTPQAIHITLLGVVLFYSIVVFHSNFISTLVVLVKIRELMRFSYK